MTTRYICRDQLIVNNVKSDNKFGRTSIGELVRVLLILLGTVCKHYVCMYIYTKTQVKTGLFEGYSKFEIQSSSTSLLIEIGFEPRT